MSGWWFDALYPPYAWWGLTILGIAAAIRWCIAAEQEEPTPEEPAQTTPQQGSKETL